MRILVLGSGGREHAIVWKLSKSTTVEKIFLAGNVMIDCLLRYQELASKFSTSWACVRVDRDAALTECSPCTGPQMWGIQDPARNSQRS